MIVRKLQGCGRCWWMCAIGFLALVSRLGAEEGASAEPKEPEFSKDASHDAFSIARSLFESGKYEEAGAQFKKIRADGKTKEDQLLVQGWIDACSGGIVLRKLKKAPPAQWLSLYDQVFQEYYPKYGKTPAGPLYKEFLEELEQACFEVLETFDVPSLAYSPKYGKTFVNDPKRSLDGTRCLRWTNTKERKPAALKIQGTGGMFPTDWTPFSHVEFYVNVAVQPRGAEAVIMCGAPGGGDEEAQPKRAAPKDFFQRPVEITSSPGKWKRIRIPIADFRQSGAANLSKVAYFQIQIPAGAAFDFLIDRVALVRREPLVAKDGAKEKKARGE